MNRDKIARALLGEISDLPLSLVRNMPGRAGVKLRWLYWSRRMRHLGAGVVFGRNVSILNPEHVSIQSRTWIDDNVTLLAGPPGERKHMHRLKGHDRALEGKLEIGPKVHIAVGAVIQAHGGVTIGEGMGIASGSMVYSLSHHYRNPKDRDDDTLFFFGPMVDKDLQSMVMGHVVLGKGSAMGLNSVVLPASVLNEWTWLASGGVFGGSSPRGAILAGNPAKVVKMRPGFEEPEA